jgi:hypothetical protein
MGITFLTYSKDGCSHKANATSHLSLANLSNMSTSSKTYTSPSPDQNSN